MSEAAAAANVLEERMERFKQETSVLVVCALTLEREAMLAAMDKLLDVSDAELSFGSVAKHTVAVGVLPEMGNTNAALLVSKLLQSLPNARKVMMVGIAGGVPRPGKPEANVGVGDCVVSSDNGVIPIDLGKTINGKVKNTFNAPIPANDLVLIARGITAGNVSWNATFKSGEKRGMAVIPPAKKFTPTVFLGEVGSGGTVIKDAAFRDQLAEQYPKMRAIEMEAYGVAKACHAEERGYLVIRGISDLCDEGKHKAQQPYAALVAAAYARAVLRKMPVPEAVTALRRAVKRSGSKRSMRGGQRSGSAGSDREAASAPTIDPTAELFADGPPEGWEGGTIKVGGCCGMCQTLQPMVSAQISVTGVSVKIQYDTGSSKEVSYDQLHEVNSVGGTLNMVEVGTGTGLGAGRTAFRRDVVVSYLEHPMQAAQVIAAALRDYNRAYPQQAAAKDAALVRYEQEEREATIRKWDAKDRARYQRIAQAKQAGREPSTFDTDPFFYNQGRPEYAAEKGAHHFGL